VTLADVIPRNSGNPILVRRLTEIRTSLRTDRRRIDGALRPVVNKAVYSATKAGLVALGDEEHLAASIGAAP
jgi:hypothetical protein